MAPLSQDRLPLSWAQVQEATSSVRQRATHELLHRWPAMEQRSGDPLLWGDEIESMLVQFDHERHRAPLSLSQERVLRQLDAYAAVDGSAAASDTFPSFQPEYARYMVESTPGRPYGANVQGFCTVEPNMRYRRALIQAQLPSNEAIMSLSTYPLLGIVSRETDGGMEDHVSLSELPMGTHLHGPILNSACLPDEIITPFHRYLSLSANTRYRSGQSQLDIDVPRFADIETPGLLEGPTPGLPPPIHMDALPFGTGCCGLQATIQAESLAQARHIHDLLVPLSPILLALTAASPAFMGQLADVDARWSVLEQSCDDRTQVERGQSVPTPPEGRIHKSRWDSVSLYLGSTEAGNKPQYSDIPHSTDRAVYTTLTEGGMEYTMAQHFSQVLSRDPLLLFEGSPPTSGAIQAGEATECLDRFLTTTWPMVRLKPPCAQTSTLGWRVEARSMEVQLTDLENAAFTTFVVLLVRTFLWLDANVYMRLSMVDENMYRAQHRDAVRTQHFFFRTHLTDVNIDDEEIVDPDQVGSYTMNELINGKATDFPGLIPLIHQFLDAQSDIHPAHRTHLDGHLSLIRDRASGTLLTPATYMRQFVRAHQEYQRDSTIPPSVAYDLLYHLHQVERGVLSAPQLLPAWYAQHMAEQDHWPTTPPMARHVGPSVAPTAVASDPETLVEEEAEAKL